MLKPITGTPEERTPLSRERVLHGAVTIAGDKGIGSLTIRSLAQHLGVKPMSLYHYVANKDEILDGIVDLVFSQIHLPSLNGPWWPELHKWAHSARRVLTRNSWAIALLESRATPGAATLRHHDRIIGVLRGGGFSVAMTAHAYALLDSYVYGFALQEAALPFDRMTVAPAAESILELFPDGAYPHLVELAEQHILQPDYDFSDEFEFGLVLILNGLAPSIPGKGNSDSSAVTNPASFRQPGAPPASARGRRG
jgi:AcrR family transcriptional regulator